MVGPPVPGRDAVREQRPARLPQPGACGRSGSLRDYAGMMPPSGSALRCPRPRSNFYEMAASRMGFLPEPFAFSVRAFAALSRSVASQGERWDVIHDVQCLGYGLLGLRAMGVPVVTTVHHPLDRRPARLVHPRRDASREAIGSDAVLSDRDAGVRRAPHRPRRSPPPKRAPATSWPTSAWRPTSIAQRVWNGLDTDLYSPRPQRPQAQRR